MLEDEKITNIFEELYDMKVIIPDHPADFYKNLKLLQIYMNRIAEIQIGILSEIIKPDLSKADRSRLKALKEAADITSGNLKLTKQQFALIINNAEVFNVPKLPTEIDFTKSDIPGQSGLISAGGLEFFDESEGS